MGGDGKPELSSEEVIRRVMEREREARPVMEWVMCPTCCGFVLRKKRIAMPNPDDAFEVEEMLEDPKEMRAAVMLKYPDGQVMEPGAAMEHERCPTCYRPLSDTPETKSCKEEKMVAADETMGADSAGSKRMVAGDETMMNKRSKKEGKNKKKRSKNKKKRSKNKKKKSKNKNGEKSKMVASEGEAMAADLGSREDSGYSVGRTGKTSDEYPMGRTEKSSSESNEYPMGRTEKSSSESNEYPVGRTDKSSSESNGRRSSSESNSTGLTGNSSSDGSVYSMGKRRTKMVTCRLSKEFVRVYFPGSSFTHITNRHLRSLLSRRIAEYEVKCELHASWQSQCDMKGYAEYQVEVTDDEHA